MPPARPTSGASHCRRRDRPAPLVAATTRATITHHQQQPVAGSVVVAAMVALLGRLSGGVMGTGVGGEVAGVAGSAAPPPNSPHAPIPPSEAHVDQHVPGPKMKSQAVKFGTAKRAPIASSCRELRVEYSNFFHGHSERDLWPPAGRFSLRERKPDPRKNRVQTGCFKKAALKTRFFLWFRSKSANDGRWKQMEARNSPRAAGRISGTF